MDMIISDVVGLWAKRVRKTYPDIHSVAPASVDSIINKIMQQIGQKSSEISVQISRPLGISTVLVICIGKRER